jgi:hypothetical protein
MVVHHKLGHTPLNDTPHFLRSSVMDISGMIDDLKIPQGEFLLQTAAGSVLGRQV